MTISAQQTKVASVGSPILESASPCVLTVFCPNLFSRVYVVNIEGAVIIKTTLNALTAKLSYQFKFALPITGAFVDAVSVLVPVVKQAAARTKTVWAPFAAGFAFTGLAPAVSQITSLSAILSAFVPTRWLAAMFTSIHALIIPNYFACERIENAQRQTRMFA